MNRDEFLKKFIRKKKITVDGDELEISELTLGQREKLMQLLADDSMKETVKQAVIVCMALDFLDEENQDDIDAVVSRGAVAVTDIAEQVYILSGLKEVSDGDQVKN
ncbi:hypothetical protein [Methylophaga lonarensis]|uniref:hypothetical protein n=1 Tax=Methylophaga lonarensis TaxID=999151 RepID=UPI003D277458